MVIININTASSYATVEIDDRGLLEELVALVRAELERRSEGSDEGNRHGW